LWYEIKEKEHLFFVSFVFFEKTILVLFRNSANDFLSVTNICWLVAPTWSVQMLQRNWVLVHLKRNKNNNKKTNKYFTHNVIHFNNINSYQFFRF
jgi:hypothetical protein